MGGTGKIGKTMHVREGERVEREVCGTARAGRQVKRRVGETEVRTYQLRDDACAGRRTGGTGGVWHGGAAGRQVERRVGETEVRTYQLRDDACAGRWTGGTGGVWHGGAGGSTGGEAAR
jgi:hypothetical protein